MDPSTLFLTNGPVAAGAGEVVLDFLVDDRSGSPLLARAGGSTGNVLTFLAYFGWQAHPIARIGNDPAGSRLLDELNHWGVQTSGLDFTHPEGTPIIVERILFREGEIVGQKFTTLCPFCPGRLPWYLPLPAESIPSRLEAIPAPQVFTFDQPDPGTLHLAQECRKRGALVLFEPLRPGEDDEILRECIAAADLVKRSLECDSRVETILRSVPIPLEIATLGPEGLRYRLRDGRSNGRWKALPPRKVYGAFDTVGCGDACSAGILHALGRSGRQGFAAAGVEEIERGLDFGQAVAAVNCLYLGARGSMEALSRPAFAAAAAHLLAGEAIGPMRSVPETDDAPLAPHELCPHCRRREIGCQVNAAS